MRIATVILILLSFAYSPSKKIIQDELAANDKLTITLSNEFPLVEELANAL